MQSRAPCSLLTSSGWSVPGPDIVAQQHAGSAHCHSPAARQPSAQVWPAHPGFPALRSTNWARVSEKNLHARMQVQVEMHLSTHEVRSPLPKQLFQLALSPVGALGHHCLIASPNLLHIEVYDYSARRAHRLDIRACTCMAILSVLSCMTASSVRNISLISGRGSNKNSYRQPNIVSSRKPCSNSIVFVWSVQACQAVPCMRCMGHTMRASCVL